MTTKYNIASTVAMILLFSLSSQAQDKEEMHKIPSNLTETVDHTFHCKKCKAFLFDDSKVSIDAQQEIHFKSQLAGHIEGGYQCPCGKHIGAYDADQKHYQVSLDNVHEEGSGDYHCSGCHKRLFEGTDLLNSDDEQAYFSRPIIEQKSRPADKKNYYKVDIAVQTMSCHGCEAPIGTVTDSDSQTYDAKLDPTMLIKTGS